MPRNSKNTLSQLFWGVHLLHRISNFRVKLFSHFSMQFARRIFGSRPFYVHTNINIYANSMFTIDFIYLPQLFIQIQRTYDTRATLNIYPIYKQYKYSWYIQQFLQRWIFNSFNTSSNFCECSKSRRILYIYTVKTRSLSNVAIVCSLLSQWRDELYYKERVVDSLSHDTHIHTRIHAPNALVGSRESESEVENDVRKRDDSTTWTGIHTHRQTVESLRVYVYSCARLCYRIGE